MAKKDLFQAAVLLLGEFVDAADETSDKTVKDLGHKAANLLQSLEKAPKVDPHDPLELASFVHRLATDFPLSVTGWGRTQAHNDRLGGSAKDPALRWQAFDIVVEEPKQIPALKDRLAEANLELTDAGLYSRIQPRTRKPGD